MTSPSVTTKVYLFHGAGSTFTNAVFSSRPAAAAWIARHKLTGILTAYTIDDPDFDRHQRESKLPLKVRNEPNISADFIQRYAAGNEHTHYYYGLGEGDEGHSQAADQWHKDNSHA